MRKLHRDLTESEHKQALKELEAAHYATPLPAKEKDKRLILRRIATDTTEPHHVRAEALRILDVGDVMPAADFSQRWHDFMSTYTPAATPFEISKCTK